jgi:VWFA-related protein
MRAKPIIALILGVAAAASGLSQIRARVELVVVPVSVRDSKGKLVAALVKDDFTITEDGVRQTISDFDIEPQPISAVLVVDDGMSGEKLKLLNPPGAESLFVTLTGMFGPEDEMAAYRYDHFVEKLSDFTNDPLAIQKSFEIIAKIAETRPEEPRDLLGEKGPKWLRSVLNILKKGSNGGGPGIPSATSDRRATPRASSRVLHNVVHEAAVALQARPENRRKIIVVISDGAAGGSANIYTFAQNTNLLVQHQIQFYGISAEYGSFGALEPYAKATGGDVYPGTSSQTMETSFGRATEQARYQYVLSYVSTNRAPRIGAFRTIKVTTRLPKVTVAHRKGYMQYPQP